MNTLFKKFMALFLVLATLCGFGLTTVAEATSEVESKDLAPLESYVSDVELPTSDELFATYFQKTLYDEDAYSAELSNGTAAGQRLSGDAKKLYDALAVLLTQVADGERSSTDFWIGVPMTDRWADDTVDYWIQFSGTGITRDDIVKVYTALLIDLPYAQYWHDKVYGISWGTSYYPQQLRFQFRVASSYGTGNYTVNTSKTRAAKNTAANAKSIVNANAGKTDYQKLLAYKDALCQMTDYNFDAVSGDSNSYFHNNVNPWQLIYAFDNDPSTKIVCEGYSKAFMYLCDLSTFTDNVTCITVSGDMSGGAHMWNVVEINGKSYLVDVTNSDSGSVGQNGGLFMVGTSGSVSSGYTFLGYRFRYDQEDKDLWGTGSNSILALESSNYTPPAVHNHSLVTDYGYAATCTVNGKTNGQHCSTCGQVTTPQQIIYAKGHVFDSYEDKTCNICGHTRVDQPRPVTHMYRMYNPNTGEHFYTGSDVEKNNLIGHGWQYEGVGFSFPTTTGKPVHRLFEPATGEHLYTMDEAEKANLMASGWNYEGIAFNSGFEDEVPQFRLHNPNATVGAYHFTASPEERDNLISQGWEYQGIGWYSCWN